MATLRSMGMATSRSEGMDGLAAEGATSRSGAWTTSRSGARAAIAAGGMGGSHDLTVGGRWVVLGGDPRGSGGDLGSMLRDDLRPGSRACGGGDGVARMLPSTCERMLGRTRMQRHSGRWPRRRSRVDPREVA